LVVSKVKGEAIPLPIVREIAVLSKVSVLEYRVQGGRAAVIQGGRAAVNPLHIATLTKMMNA